MKLQTKEQLLRKFSKMPDVLQCDILEKSFERYYVLKSRNESKQNRAELLLKALLFSLEVHQNILNITSAKKHSKDSKSLEEKFNMQVTMVQAAEKKKKITKSFKLLNHYAPLVYRLIEEEHFSYKKVKTFLAQNHSLKVDHTLIARLYPAIKQKIHDLKEAQKQANTII